MNILYAGLFHETHTFSDVATGLEDFKTLYGTNVLQRVGDGSQTDGFLTTALARGVNIVPAADFVATPSGLVAEAVVANFMSAVESAIEAADCELDAAFLALHGAMVSVGTRDVEGEVISRVRAAMRRRGVRCARIFGVTDLHGNVSAEMVGDNTALLCYRENPHIDAYNSGKESTELMLDCLNRGIQVHTSLRRFPVLLAPGQTATSAAPMKDMLDLVKRYERNEDGVLSASVYAGFSYADTPDAGVSVTVTTRDSNRSHECLYREVAEVLRTFALHERLDVVLPDDHLRQLDADPAAPRPLVIADPADNVGGGAPGDTTGLLRAFMRFPRLRSLAIIWDPESVRRHWARPVGDAVDICIGGRGSGDAYGPFSAKGRIVGRHDGRFDLEDRNSHLAAFEGASSSQGRTLVIRIGNATVVLHSRRIPPFDLGQLTSLGIDPSTFDAISCKAAVAHRRAYDKIAGGNVTVELPGCCPADLRKLNFHNLRRPIHPIDNFDSWSQGLS